MKPTKDVVAAFVDVGLFGHVARRLASEFKKVYYVPACWETAFPKLKDAVVGDGYPEIEWVESIWEVADKIDLAVYPDIGRAFEQQILLKMGIRVWGSRHADGLEARRGLFLKAIETTSLPIPKHKVVTGMSDLRKYLADSDGKKFLKVSTWRGNFETACFRSMAEDESLLDDWSMKMGPLREKVKIFVFDEIETVIEDGCDTHRAGGKWPSIVVHGMENKDKSYLGTFCPFDELPDPVRKVNEEFGPILDGYGYAGPFSTEVRITEEGLGYFIDLTARYGSPPSQVQCEMIANMGEIAWYGANGICVDPEPADKFGVQALFSVDREDWQVFKLPPEIEKHVRIGFSCMVDGMVCVPPDPQGASEIGWLCATGSTIEYAIHNLIKYNEEMPSGVEVRIDTLAGLLKEAKEANEQGQHFADNIPDPDIISA